jgi:hypothetical protein
MMRLLELIAAVIILGAGIAFYRRKPVEGDDGGGYGSQGAVLLFVIAAIMLIHGLGGLDYHPSASEIDMAKGLTGMRR